jgi:hypothetical protein
MAYRSHLTSLLEQLCPSNDDYLAEVLLAALAPELILHQLDQGKSPGSLQDGWAELVRRLVN